LFNERIAAVAFDVRGDPGDHYDMVPHPTFTARLFTIPGNPETFYDRPIAVLTGPGAVSNGDWESLRMGFHPMVRTFGKPSNGAFTPSESGSVGSDYWVTGATGSGYLLDGHRYLAHTGVPVDVEVWLTPRDAARGVDTVVTAAINWIQGPAPRQVGRRMAK
jgi:C-terminal processing protease CtpA/Prc